MKVGGSSSKIRCGILVMLMLGAAFAVVGGTARAGVIPKYVGNTIIDLSWNEYDSTDFSKYEVVRDGIVIQTIPDRRETFFRDSELDKGSTYTYSVEVYNATGVLKEVTTTSATTGMVHGIITLDTTWEAASSPFSITGAVNVRDGSSLTIEDGVVVINASQTYKPQIVFEDKGAIANNISVFDVDLEVHTYAHLTNCTLKFARLDLYNVNDSVIRGNSLSGYGGIFLYDSTRNNIIEGNTVQNNSYTGIGLSHSADTKVIGNKVLNITRYGYDGIYLHYSDNNVIQKNRVNNTLYDGIGLYASSHNLISDNRLTNNNEGIHLDTSNNNDITDNNSSHNRIGIRFYGSSNNNITGNSVANNNYFGIYLHMGSESNCIYNNYFNNSKNAYDSGNNSWEITKTAGTNIVGGPFRGGNYWNDYKGTDLDGDKLGDTLLPYNSSGSIQFGGDWHPLIIIPKVILKASKDGYTSVKQEVDNGQNFEEIVISGTVIDEYTREPIEDAKVEIVKGANFAAAYTNAKGNYTITAIIPEGSGSDTREDVNFELPPAEYIVGVYEITSEVFKLIEENNGTILDQCQYVDGPRALLVNISKADDIDSFIDNVGSSPLAKYVELNGIVHTCYVPNDPRYPSQWGPQNIHAGGPPNPSAWDVERGNLNITIAIVDTGIQYDHTDLYRRVDGKTKYIYGYDWVDMDDNPSPVANERHGTHCTGIATAVMDNGVGIAGICPDCSFIAERALNRIGRGTVWTVSRAIMDAADHDADIISMSFGSNRSSEFRRNATLYASSLGCILVAASGNDANENWYTGIPPTGIGYPAAYPWVIAVGATGQTNQRAIFSNWGNELDLVAPGVSILSTVPTNDYAIMNGTSMATPHVAGVAALVKSRAERWPEEPYATNPWYHLNNDQIQQVLIQSAIDLGSPGWDEEYGYGKVDAAQAVRCVNISGNVLEAVLNAPVPQAEVRVTSIEGPPGTYTTNERTALANITFEKDYHVRVPQGMYSICAMAYGYIPSQGFGGDRLELPAFDINGQLYKDYRDFRLVPFPCNVTGNVRDSVTGMLITDASISLDGPPDIIPPHPNVHMDTSTDIGGNYHFILEYSVHPPYPAGEAIYNITVTKPGYESQTKNFTLNWSTVVTDYYKCPLDPRDYNPPSVNFSLVPSSIPLPDLTLTSEDIQFSHSASNPTISSVVNILWGINAIDLGKPTVSAPQSMKNARISEGVIPSGIRTSRVTDPVPTPSFSIVNLTYPFTVDPNQTFQVTVTTSYSFDTATLTAVGIWDYTAEEYIDIAGRTLSGIGNANFTFNLTAPSSGIMDLSADLYYKDGDDVIFSDYRDFTVSVGEHQFTIINLTYPSTVTPNQTFKVIVNTSYSFDETTFIYAGIWDYNASDFLAGTPDNDTLSGIGTKSYTFNLTAPSEGAMNLAATLWYLYSPLGWFLADLEDLTVVVGGEPADFALNATPSSRTIAQGNSTSYLISLLARNGFNASVTLNLSGLPSGAIGVFNPNPVVPTNSSNLTLSTSSTTPVGNYTLTISGSGAGITHQTTVTLQVLEREAAALISATVHNIGPVGASNVIVQFFDGDPNAGGTQIGSDQTIAAIPAKGTGHAEVAWDLTGAIGTYTVYVRIDPSNSITESNEGNNQAFRQFGVPGVTCSDPSVTIDDAHTSVTDDPLGDGYNLSNAPANVDLSSAKGFTITATGPNGTYVFNITFVSPITESFKLFKLPHWRELPYNVLDACTIQVQLNITGGVLDPAFILTPVAMFDTGRPANPYPSISGTFKGTITPNQTLPVSQLYLYPCPSTGGHAEYVRIYGNGLNESASWSGYVGDWRDIAFNTSFVLDAGKTYNYTIRTGSYPQIIHQTSLNAPGGTIRCTEFVDLNGNRHEDWLPAIKLWSD